MSSLSDLPQDELLRYALALGLIVDESTPQGELLRLVRERQDLLDSLDREVLVELIKWSRRAVHANATKEELAREIAAGRKMIFDGLSQGALYALCRLRNIDATPVETSEELTRKLHKAEGWMDRFRRKRNSWLGGLVNRWFLGGAPDKKGKEDGDYQFLPDAERGPSLEEQIQDKGFIGGIAERLRSSADDYVKEKLDEIERRIDRKLDEIDKRLSEWRDRELGNRLRIFKLTLAASVLVATVSLAYNLFSRLLLGGAPAPATKDVPAATAPGPEKSDTKPESKPAPADDKGGNEPRTQ